MKSRILLALLRKEFIRIRRNTLMPRVIIMLPIMAMLVIPLIATLDVKHVIVTIVDNDHSPLSRRIIADMDASEYLSVGTIADNYSLALKNVEEGLSDIILTIPPYYEKNILSGVMPKVDIQANGVNATKGAIGAQYVAKSVSSSIVNYFPYVTTSEVATPTSVMYLYNPTLNFKNFMIPALIVILLIIICGFLPTLNLVGEIETGTIEAMNVTPVGRFTFILSKLIPFWIIGLVVVSIGMFIGWAVYDLSPKGSVPGFYIASILFSLVMSGLGVMIANRSTTMIQSIFVMFAIVMIFQLMSGLFTPIASMPEWAITLTYAIPPRYFIEIMRALYLRGTPVAELWSQFGALACFAVVFCAGAALTYRKQN